MENLETVVGPSKLKRSSRQTLSISVLPDGTVEIVAPICASVVAIQKKVAKRAIWIRKQRRFFSGLRVEHAERRYCTGATHRYLGRQYRLKVRAAQTLEPSVKIHGAYLHIDSRSKSKREIAGLVSKWMREQARDQFQRRLSVWRRWCAELGLPEPKLGLRTMSKRWGSAHSSGRIFLNPDLVRAPRPCIDYVIAHEICHIKHPRHDKGFYAELEKLCPKWRNRKQRLESVEL